MGFLNETGGSLRATWQNVSIAARWGLVLAAAAIVATSIWWSRRAPEISHVALFPGHTLAPSELVAMEAAFGRARLNGARLVDGHFEVPAERKDDYVRALIDNQALPATPSSFSERLIAQDNLFTSPRQRDALMKLAKEREIALMVRQIAGISEATVHYEDVDGEGFPRRKSRRATVAVRTRSERPLAPQLLHAIRTTVANSLGIASADAIAVLDLNEGIAYTDSATSVPPSPGNSPKVSPEQRSMPGAPTRRNGPESQTGERSAERTGPIQLATFDAPRDEQSRVPATNDIPARRTPASAPVIEQAAEPLTESATKPTREPGEPRLLPKSILLMVRPASHEERDSNQRSFRDEPSSRDGLDSKESDSTDGTGAPHASESRNKSDARVNSDARIDAGARVDTGVRIDASARSATGARIDSRATDLISKSRSKSRSESEVSAASKTDHSVVAGRSSPARAVAAQARSDERSSQWTIWLRDHGPTVGGCGAGLGLVMWLLRALLNARWDARMTPEIRVERFESHADQTMPKPVGAPAADATDARRELADRVRADTSTAAAKLRQWLGHAA